MSLLQTKLVNRSDLALYVQISKSVNDDKLNEMIIKAQLNEVLPLLGERLYNDILANTVNYANLLNGHNYTFNGITYVNYGLKAVISHYVDAYYKMFGDVTDTPFGLVNKLNGNESRPIDNSFKKSMFTLNKQTAFNIWLSVENYLIRENVPLFRDGVCRQKQSFNLSKISR